MEPLSFHIQLLGGFRIDYGGEPLTTISTPRLQSLLAYLVLNANIPQSRQHVAFLLWPDTDESNARNNLRQFIHQLRQLLPDPDRFLRIDANSICWHLDEGQIIDVQRFERVLSDAETAGVRGDTGAVQHRLKEALSIYQGDLLPGCYEDWILAQRERLRQRCFSAAQKLVDVLEGEREYAEALQTAQALLDLDPLDESSYITLIRLHDLNQDHPAARRVYQSAVEILQRELGVDPSESLRQAYDRSHAPASVTANQTFGRPAGTGWAPGRMAAAAGWLAAGNEW